MFLPGLAVRLDLAGTSTGFCLMHSRFVEAPVLYPDQVHLIALLTQVPLAVMRFIDADTHHLDSFTITGA